MLLLFFDLIVIIVMNHTNDRLINIDELN